MFSIFYGVHRFVKVTLLSKNLFKMPLDILPNCFIVTSPDFCTETFVTTLGAGQFAGSVSMLCPKGLFHGWFEYLMAFRTNVFYTIEIIPDYKRSPQGGNYHPDYKWPPYAFDNPEYNSEALKHCDRNPH